MRKTQRTQGNVISFGSVNIKHAAGRLIDGAQRVMTNATRLRTNALVVAALPVALTLLVAVTMGAAHSAPSIACPGNSTPC
jgi:hypothetical protein